MSIQKGNDQHDLNEIAHATKSAMTDAPKLPDEPERFYSDTKYIGTGEYVGHMTPDADGEYVMWSDYDALRALASTAIEENVLLKNTLEVCNTIRLQHLRNCESAMQRASAAETRAAALGKAADALVNRLDTIHADPKYQAVWTLHQVHGGQYSGPTYIEELANLRAAIVAQK